MKYISLIKITLIYLLVITACHHLSGNDADPEVAESAPPLVPASYHLSENETDPEVYVLVQDVDNDEEPWRAAYAALLREYWSMTTHLPIEDTWHFNVFDINRDGIPELIIWESIFGGFFWSVHAVYTFYDGAAQMLTLDAYFGGRPGALSLSPPPNNAPGMVVNGGGEGFTKHTLINMVENRLVKNICAMLITTSPRYSGDNNILFYVKGVDAESQSLPPHFYWLEEEHNRRVSGGYLRVDCDVFYEVRDVVLGVINSESVSPRLIIEPNIYNLTLGLFP